MQIFLSVHDTNEALMYQDFIEELTTELQKVEAFKDVPIEVKTKQEMDAYFSQNRLHDLPSLTDAVAEACFMLPDHLLKHGNGMRRFMAFRSYPAIDIHTITFRIS